MSWQSDPQIMVANAIVAVTYTAIISPLVLKLYPWGCSGRRKHIKTKRRRRPWE